MIFLVAALVGLGIVLVFIGLAAPDPSDTIQERLLEYSGRETPVTLEEIELSIPFTQRIIVPMVRSVADFITRFTPQKTLESTRHKLELAGNPYNWSAAEFMGFRLIAAVLLAGLFFLLFTVLKAPMSRRLLFTGLAGGTGYLFPALWLGSKIRRRQDEIVKALPDALDLLTICVEAGLGFDAAMNKVVEKWDNALATEFARVIQEIRLGKPRREALRNMADRTEVADVTTFVAAIIQADQLGVSIAQVLRIQSDQMRMRRRQRAEEKAHQAPVKMMFPLVFFIFPTIWIVLLGPAVLQVMELNVFGNF